MTEPPDEAFRAAPPRAEPMGVAVIGAGDMGARHGRHWNAAGARVVGVYDPDAERTAALARDLGADAASDPDELVRRADVQVVSVCTPTFLHARYSIAALDAGKHVLCEKPAALTLAEGYAMRDAARRSGACLRIGFMRRFDPASHQLAAFRHRIGGPVLAQATLTAGIRPKLLMHDAAANGGPIIDMCCHLFDGWMQLFGAQAERVRAHGYTFGEGKLELAGIARKALDSAQITLEYPDGSVGQIQVSWGLPSGVDPVERHTYLGPDGLVTVDWPGRVELRDAGGVRPWHNSGRDPWQAEIAAFYAELRSGVERGLGTIEDGIEALRTSLAVLDSVATGTIVRVPEVDTAEVAARVTS